MNRPNIAPNAAIAVVNEVQPITMNDTKNVPIMNPRRSAWATAAAVADRFDGLGGTVCGFASLCGALAAGAGLVAVAVPPALAATSLAFLAPVWRSASARSRGSDIFSSGGSVRAAATLAGAAPAAGLAAAGLAAAGAAPAAVPPPALAAASFSLSVSGRPSFSGVGTSAAG